MSDDVDEISMAIMSRFGQRPSTTLAGRRARETRPLSRSDRMSISVASTKTRQLNLKVTPEFYDRVAAMARNRNMSMPNYIEWAVEQAERR